ncbi:MAG: hypothetical protein LUH14_11045 [Clostridiaceae bacterium]|nr:hypothetical protein [Clostridiaceae bacterium]
MKRGLRKFFGIILYRIPHTKIPLLVLWIVAAACILLLPVSVSDCVMTVNYRENIDSTAALYYDTGNGYSESNVFSKTIHNKKASFDITEKLTETVQQFRLDPTILAQNYQLVSLTIQYDGFETVVCYEGSKLRGMIEGCGNIKEISVQDDGLLIQPENGDSQLYLEKDFLEDSRLMLRKTLIFERLFLVTVFYVCIVLIVVLRKQIGAFFILVAQNASACLRSRKRGWFILGVFVCYCLCCLVIFMLPYDVGEYSIQVEYNKQENAEDILYFDKGNGFLEKKAIYDNMDASSMDVSSVFSVSSQLSKKAAAYRFLLTGQEGIVYLHSITVQSEKLGGEKNVLRCGARGLDFRR